MSYEVTDGGMVLSVIDRGERERRGRRDKLSTKSLRLKRSKKWKTTVSLSEEETSERILPDS